MYVANTDTVIGILLSMLIYPPKRDLLSKYVNSKFFIVKSDAHIKSYPLFCNQSISSDLYYAIIFSKIWLCRHP